MASKIEWTEETWNPLAGCTVLSPGCTNCYAMRDAWNRLRNHPKYEGLTKLVNGKPVWTGEMRFWEPALDQPLRWRKPRMIFVNSMSDLFHEDVPDEWIDRIFAVMALSPQHTFQILTKRSERMRDYLSDAATSYRILNAADCMDMALEMALPLPNVWCGISAERQQEAEERIPHLLDTPAAVRWLSVEPQLGPIDLTSIPAEPKIWPGKHDLGENIECLRHMDALRGVIGWVGSACTPSESPDETGLPHVDWVVVGGESGPGARPFDLAWARSLIVQCRETRTAVFVKQIGARPVDAEHKLLAAHVLDSKGGDMSEWPEDLRVREHPDV